MQTIGESLFIRGWRWARVGGSAESWSRKGSPWSGAGSAKPGKMGEFSRMRSKLWLRSWGKMGSFAALLSLGRGFLAST